jgi:hypothetical protein
MGLYAKTIYSLLTLRQLLEAAHRRYLEFLSAIEDPRTGRDKLDKPAALHRARRIQYQRPAEHDAARYLPDKISGQVSRLSKRLCLHGITKKIGRTYKYYLTDFGK